MNLYKKYKNIHELYGYNVSYNMTHSNMQKLWYKNGLLHRDDGPAITYIGGSTCWYQNGLLHREDGPAQEWETGNKHWYQHGKRHREDGPAIEYENGDKHWYINNKLISPDNIKKIITNGTNSML